LSEVAGPAATYQIVGNEGYVRARVIESNGRLAWVQPVAVGRPRPAPPVVALLCGAFGCGVWLMVSWLPRQRARRVRMLQSSPSND